MTYTKREQTIAIVLGIVLGVVFLDKIVVEPIWAWRTDTAAQLKKLRATKAEDQALLRQSHQGGLRWTKMRAAGLTKDASSAESLMTHAVQNASQRTDLRLELTRLDRDTVTNGIDDLTFQVTGAGSMQSIAQFLDGLETAAMPMRIHELKIESRANNDDLQLTLQISTLWEDPQAKVNAGAKQPAQEE